MIRPGKQAFEDLAGMAGGAMNIMAGLREQIKNEIKSRVDETLARLDVVPKEDYDALQARVDDLASRLETLEKQTKKPTAKKK